MSFEPLSTILGSRTYIYIYRDPRIACNRGETMRDFQRSNGKRKKVVRTMTHLESTPRSWSRHDSRYKYKNMLVKIRYCISWHFFPCGITHITRENLTSRYYKHINRNVELVRREQKLLLEICRFIYEYYFVFVFFFRV